MPRYPGPCAHPDCDRGAIGGWGWQFKDGPCEAQPCLWPEDLPPRPHFSDNPTRLVYKGDGRWVFEWD